MDDCVFCNIVNKVLETEILYEDDRIIVFRDILPKAPVHLIVTTKKHIPSLNHMQEGEKDLLGDMIYTARHMAEKFGIGETGYKLTFNVGRDGNQMIPHLHLHLLGGKQLPE
jgi:histidine triad (HIT) family protein